MNLPLNSSRLDIATLYIPLAYLAKNHHIFHYLCSISRCVCETQTNATNATGNNKVQWRQHLKVLYFYPAPPPWAYCVTEVWATLRLVYSPSLVTICLSNKGKHLKVLHFDPAPPPWAHCVNEAWATLRFVYSPSLVTTCLSKLKILHFTCKRDGITNGRMIQYKLDAPCRTFSG